MRLLRAVLGRLDPWAALLLGVLLALGVVILLATPGPWHRVVGPAPPPQLAPTAPQELAVFALGADSGACTAVVWLHVDRSRGDVTAVVLAPDTQGFIPGAGYAPLRRLVDQIGPAAAAGAMGQALHVPMDAWVTLDQQALQLALAPQSATGAGREPLIQYGRARAAWEGRGGARRVWDTQYQALSSTLARLPFERINVVAFSNYVLGWGHVQSDLDLQGATSLGATLSELLPGHVDVRAAAVIVETCRRGDAWRVDPGALEQLKQSLALGLSPPPAGIKVTRRVRPARVLVVLPGAGDGSAAYVREVRRSLRGSAGAPVTVRTLEVPLWDDLAPQVSDAIASWRPLAVLVGPPAGVQPGDAAKAAVEALRGLGEWLRAAGQPAVMSAPLSAGGDASATLANDALVAAVRAGGQPLSPLDGATGTAAGGSPASSSSGGAALAAAARANIATLVRACWPGTLAPRLASTRLGFSFAARRKTTVGVVAAEGPAAQGVVSRLQTWGYRTTPVLAGGWSARRSGIGVFYREGMRRAAVVLAGDLGLPASFATADASAPSALALSLP